MSCIAPGCSRAARVPPGFCAVHAKAPAGQRGGWISAHQRKAGTATETRRAPLPLALDASPVFHRLWMGSKPPVDRQMRSLDAIVLCADSYQPQLPHYHGRVIRCPIEDGVPTANELAMAAAAAKQAAAVWKGGGRVLVTCYAGLNRSGLVTGLVLLAVTRKRAPEVIAMIRSARGANALYNQHFVRVLESVDALERAKRPA